MCDQRTVPAVALDSGEVACRHSRVFVRHRTVATLQHARALRSGRRGVSAEAPVEVRLLDRFRDRQSRQPRRPVPDQGRSLPRAEDARGVRLRLPDEPAARQVLHLGQLDFLAGKGNVVLLGPPRTRQDPPGHRVEDPGLPGPPLRRVQNRDRMGRAARRRPTPRPPGLRARPVAARPAADRRRGRLHPVRPAGRQPDVECPVSADTAIPG